MTRKVLVGMLLLGALFVFGLATFYVKNWQFHVGKGYRLVANFPVVHTLDTGDVVRMAGVVVGTVEELTISTEAATQFPVRAVLWIREGVVVRADDQASIRMTSVFGGSFVAIERGDPQAQPLSDGDTLERTLVAPSVTEVVEQSKATLAEIKNAFEDVRTITAELREGKGALGRLIKDEEFYTKLDKMATDLSEATGRLQAGEGTLGKLVMDEKMAADVEALVTDARELAEHIREISEGIRTGEGTLGQLVSSDELYTALNDAVATVSEVATLFKEGEGVAARLLQDPEMAEDLRTLAAEASQTAANLKEVTNKIAEGESSLGRLLESDEAYQKLNASLDDLNAFTESLAEGTGTVGKLVRDDEAYKKLTTLIDSVQGIVDTYREQSPVISFAGAIFGAF
jgi:phospholipid/cholesterol/gamma-HCH transport system substrate-binding protein